MKARFWIAALGLSVLVSTVQASVSVEGQVLRPGTYDLSPGARLSDAAIIGLVSQDAWPLGAAWLRDQARYSQRRLQAGLLFDLQQAAVNVLSQRSADEAALLFRLRDEVAAMPVTGRVQADLTPLQLLLVDNNHLLASGDRLIYPRRPEQVRVMGAVTESCTLPFSGSLQLRDYLRQCPAHALADPSYVWIIQPDGSQQQVGIGPWNREPATLAVGAVIYRPVLQRLLSDTPELNADMAAWLATQYTLGGDFDE